MISRSKAEIRKLVLQVFQEAIDREGDFMNIPAEDVLKDENSELRTVAEVEMVKEVVRELIEFLSRE